MGHLIAHDVLTIFAVFVGAFQSARRIPGFPHDNMWAKFAIGIHVSVVVSIFVTVANPSINFSQNVPWIKTFLDFEFPLIVYAIIITLGMALLINSIYQSILVQIQCKDYILIPSSVFMSTVDLFILIHILIIF